MDEHTCRSTWKIKPINQADGKNTVFIVSQLQTCNAMISSLFRNTDYCFCLLVTSPERSWTILSNSIWWFTKLPEYLTDFPALSKPRIRIQYSSFWKRYFHSPENNANIIQNQNNITLNVQLLPKAGHL